MYARDAEKQFEENIRLFATPAASNPEKYNLCAGLANLAKDLQGLRDDVAEIKRKLGSS